MNTRNLSVVGLGCLFLASLNALNAAVSPLQPLSLIHSSPPSPAGAGGDSWLPVISPDGRYVLFGSTANNLVTNSNGNPIAALNLPRLNVYLRDRTTSTTTLVSVNLSGLGGGNGDSFPSQISTTGSYALLESSASNLVSDDTNGVTDVFLRDLVSGSTFLVSSNFSGGVGNGTSRSSMMTPDGRYVAFVSAATNLVAGDTNRIPDVFVRDMQAGTTVLVSVGAATTNSITFANSSEAPDITPDGRSVAFFSTATNLVPGVATAGEIYVRDLVAGTTTRASVDARTLLGTSNAISYNHVISADGNFVAYEASTYVLPGSGRGVILRYNVAAGSTDLISTNGAVQAANWEEIRSLAMTPDGRFVAFAATTNGPAGANTWIFLWDAQTATTTLVSGDLNGLPPIGICDWPGIDPTGRYVAFLSSATNLVTNSLAGDYHLYVRDMLAATNRLVAVDPNGIGVSISLATMPQLGSDGNLVAFENFDSSLTSNDRNRDYDVFLRDLTINPVELISSHATELPSLTPNGLSAISISSLSADGNLVTLASESDNLVANDTNGWRDVFVRDRLLGTNLLISVNTNGLSGDRGSADSTISGDGRYVAFASAADDLVAGDTNRFQDVFLRDLQTATTTLISVNSGAVGPGNNASYLPAISSQGRYILFRSKANNLAPGSFTAGSENLFLRDLQSASTYALTTAGVRYHVMSSNGRYIAFADAPGAATGRIYLWDSSAASRIYTNVSSPMIAGIGLSADGNRLLYWRGTSVLSLFATDRSANSNWLITTGVPATRSGLQLSADGRFLTYSARSNSIGTNQVYLYDLQNRVNLLVSDPAATGHSDSPVISPDGRFVAYCSGATNVPLGATSGVPQLFLYDRLSGATSLLSSSRFNSVAGDNRSLTPTFSGNGEILLFESWASDLAGSDFNHNADVFAYTFLRLSIVPGLGGQGPSLNWPVVPGAAYQVQYKDSLNDPNWLELGGSVTFVGTRAYLSDPFPATGQRFYRLVAL